MSRAAVLTVAAIALYGLALFACERKPPLPGMQANFHVPSSAMAPTLLPGDYFCVDRLAYLFGEPRRGDVATFWLPEPARELYIKRVVGLPGDEVSLRDYRVAVNGVEVPLEPTEAALSLPGADGKAIYREVLQGRTHEVAFGSPPARWKAGAPDGYANGSFRVPDGNYFVMGDLRDSSRDSRVIGTVPRDRFHGRVSWIYFSFDADGSRVRWDRIGDIVR